ncbi:MAG: leucine-rich repeat domain-containing protein [Verrucomicrobia bacterium]|nr:leucine-rich repeat domain-containing protein [Verrucomicrobiota bacterium]
MNFINQRLKPLTLGVILALSWAASLLSAATIDDLEFIVINGGAEYSVKAKDPYSIAGTLEIPSTYNAKPVTEIGIMGFAAYDGDTEFPKITSVVIPSSIKTIGASAFQNAHSLTTVTFAPDSQLTTLEDSSFRKCTSLTSIELPDSLTEIKGYTFLECTSLTSIELPDSITEIGEGTFILCNSLTSIELPDPLTTIRNNLLSYCPALTSVVIPDSVTTIEENAFFLCGQLSSIELPASLTSIDSRAFQFCKNLASITFLGSAPTLGANVFFDVGIDVGGSIFTIYDAYEDSFTPSPWNSFTYHVLSGPNGEPVFLTLVTSYSPSDQAFRIIAHNEDSAMTLNLEHTPHLGEGQAWTTLSTSDYEKVTDAVSGSVTRTMTLNPQTQPSGFYRLISADSPINN